ncbi:MAG: class I SAM-dependent methyltransferase, partial [Desulfobacteraceae bacterium]|nr:class I SAM-dependent methyltransferase [Desulfobacteraceae bacterium]
ILEIGCGDGKISTLLASNTRKYIAIDPDRQTIKNAKSMIDNVEFRIGNGESLEFENTAFDVVLFTLSLHHQDSRFALKEAHRVLIEKGQLLILEPAIDGELQQFFNIFDNETEKIKSALKNLEISHFELEQQDIFNVVMTFENQDDLCHYSFDRKKINPGDQDRIMKKLNQLRPLNIDFQSIHLNDKLNIFCLRKKCL